MGSTLERASLISFQEIHSMAQKPPPLFSVILKWKPFDLSWPSSYSSVAVLVELGHFAFLSTLIVSATEVAFELVMVVFLCEV